MLNAHVLLPMSRTGLLALTWPLRSHYGHTFREIRKSGYLQIQGEDDRPDRNPRGADAVDEMAAIDGIDYQAASADRYRSRRWISAGGQADAGATIGSSVS